MRRIRARLHLYVQIVNVYVRFLHVYMQPEHVVEVQNEVIYVEWVARIRAYIYAHIRAFGACRRSAK